MQESVLPVYSMRPGIRTPGTKLRNKHLYPLRQLTSPNYLVFNDQEMNIIKI